MTDGLDPADELRAVMESLATRLQDAVAEAGNVVAAVGAEWADATGRAWSEHAQLVVRALGRERDAAAALVDAVRREMLAREETPGSGGTGALAPPHLPGAGGVRLGSTHGRRAEEERGVHIARLGEEPADQPP